jgi:hypothetical protein
VFVELWTKTRQMEAQAESARQLRTLVAAVDEAVALLKMGSDPAKALNVLERARP